MIGWLRTFLAIAVVAVAVPFAPAQTIPSFSGADGAAGNVTGGRGGRVYHVTKLDDNFNDNVVGTLDYGLNNANFMVGGVPQHRTIVFDVAGTFWLGRFNNPNYDNGWDTQSRYNLGSNVTVAGQTAPGPVYIAGGLVKAGGTNAILRNVSIAPGYGMRSFNEPDNTPPVVPTPGDFPDSYVYDAIDISGTNIMIDHVSTFYATDETISANEQANNISIQFSNISQGQNYPQLDAEGGSYTGHALGSLLQAGSNAAISVHHNLYAHLKGRLPRVGSEVGTGAYNDFRNNVFYNWLSTAGGGASGQPSFNNFVANFYLAGPGGDNPVGGSSTAITTAAGGTGIFNGSNSTGTRVYHADNLRDINKDGDPNDGAALINSNFGSSSIQATPQWNLGAPTYAGVTDTATAAYDRVLRYMGANWWTRDYDYTLGNTAAINTVDERIIHETATGTGKIRAWADDPFNSDPLEGAEWRNLLALRADMVTGAAPFNRDATWDVDLDGMPGVWELAHGLDPDVADNNGDFDADGYTNLEEYINEIAEWPAPAPVVFNGATNSRYAQITNWDVNSDPLTVGVWQPSKYDVAQINSGTSVVDVVGQHAGTLVVAANSGDTAQLNITGGWLLADDAVVVGGTPTSAGTLNLSGGTLSTPLLAKGAASQFNFTGGTLHADVVDFDLVNNGGTIAPGRAPPEGWSPGGTTINGDLHINSGALDIELASPASYDAVTVAGSVGLGGDLLIDLLDGFVPDSGDQFTILTGQAMSGAFDNLTPGGRVEIVGATGSFLVTIDPTQVTLSDFSFSLPILAGDYNDDGVVDAADYVVWRRSFETSTPLVNETASLGTVDSADYDAWRANFGATDPGSGLGSAVPEPTSALLAILALYLASPSCSNRRLRPSVATAIHGFAAP